jgi:HIRAN domain
VEFYTCPNTKPPGLDFRNAIQVKNIGRTQVGHIPRDIASRLAPLMDQKLITVEGVMVDGNRQFANYFATNPNETDSIIIVTGFSYSLNV